MKEAIKSAPDVSDSFQDGVKPPKTVGSRKQSITENISNILAGVAEIL